MDIPCVREGFLAKDLELPRGWGWAEGELPFSNNLFVKRELAGMDLTSHPHTTKYFSILPMSVCSDCVTTEHLAEISLLIIRKGQSVPAVEMGP
jgi:hypothetical protein